MTTLAEWEVNIAPHLHGIQAGAEMCSRHVGQLIYKPVFETLAFEDLEKLEILLSRALGKVTDARRAYQQKPSGD